MYDEPDDGFFIGVGVSESREFITITAGNNSQSEMLIIPAHTPEAAPIVFHPREDELFYTPTHWNGRWYILTNADDAVDFKIMTCEPGLTARSYWREFTPHQQGRYITGLHAAKDYLVRSERLNALPRIIVRHTNGQEHAIALEEEAYSLETGPGYEYDSATLRYVYDSPTTPMQWYDYDMAARTRVLRKTQEIPSGHDPADYVARRLWAEASDGKRVPITALMKRGTRLTAQRRFSFTAMAPTAFHGRRFFHSPLQPCRSRLDLCDRALRGGRKWALAGFRTANASPRKHLHRFHRLRRNADRARLWPRRQYRVRAARGRALMGAIANMRPDLWAGVIAGVPFVDVLNTMSDVSLPLTPPEWPEWGNPLESEEAYDYIASYCPYSNIAQKPYPAVLATGGLTDPRVTYWEPQKYVAKLRPHSTSGRPVLLKMNMGAGHAGSAGRFEFLRELAHDYAFAIKAIGAEEAGGGF